MTDLEQARLDHERAKRNLRRLNQEAALRYPMYAIRERTVAADRVSATLARLESLEALEATRPDGAESRQETSTETKRT
jgi:hypothetical protein